MSRFPPEDRKDRQQEHQNPFASPLAEDAAVAAAPELNNIEHTRREHLSREATIKSFGLVAFLGAVMLSFVPIVVTLTILEIANIGIATADAAGALVGLLISVALAGVHWWVALGLRRFNPATRVAGILLSVLWLLFSLVGFKLLFLIISISGLWALNGV